MTESDPVHVIYEGKTYDATEFKDFHPGGPNFLRNFHGKDVSKVMNNAAFHAHTDTAFYLLKHLPEVGKEPVPDKDFEPEIDWSRSMLAQVGDLKGGYDEWINKSVFKRVRVFESDFIERFTNAKWWSVPLTYLPVCAWFIWKGLSVLIDDMGREPNSAYYSSFVFFVNGIINWTFVEYFIHRKLFHFIPPANSPLLIKLHFLLHGIHHKTPFDNLRLVAPPILAVSVLGILLPLLCAIYAYEHMFAVISGFLFGYIVYDLMHYYMHHGGASKETYMGQVSTRHTHHHFLNHEKHFGVSSAAWDKVLGTFDYRLKNKLV